jgi:hypothetical protein
MAMPNLAEWLILLGIGFAITGTIHQYRTRRHRKQLRRGFEVKQTTGETPVMRQKENDHG